MRTFLALALAALFLMVSLHSSNTVAQQSKPKYPPSRTVDVVDTLHGTPVPDPYRWLEPNDDPEVQKWTDDQNALTRSYLDAYPDRNKIKDRIMELWNYPRLSVPYKIGKRYFFSKNDGLQNQSVLYVKETLDGTPRVLIDPNKLSTDGTKAMDWWYASEDGRMIAYGVSESGSEDAVLHVKNVDTGEELSFTIERCKYASVAWEKDNSGFYYTHLPKKGTVSKEDENYYEKVYYHKLGTDPAGDPVIYERPERKDLGLGVWFSHNFRYLFFSVSEGTGQANEIYYRDMASKETKIRPIATGFKSSYSPTVVDSTMYIFTKENAANYKIMRASMSAPEQEHWQEFIPEGSDLMQNFNIINRMVVIEYLHNATSLLKLYSIDGKFMKSIDLPTLGSVGAIGGKWDEPEMFYSFSSFGYPPAIFRIDLNSSQSSLYDKTPIKIDPTAYETEQVWYPSKDGTKISMFLVHKKGLVPDGNNPTLLYGYGGFSVNQTPYFSSSLTIWFDHGGIFAYTNLRGGNEYGEKWHVAGMLDKKQNVFDDFAAAAEWLIANKYTNPQKLAIEGGSNGGLLVGAVMVQHPELFKAVLCEVPLLDMIRYHQFLIARYWIPEYGSSEDADQFKFLLAYSPYHNVKPGVHYPATLIKAGESDGRVHPLHARKFAALLQKVNVGDNPILLWVERKAGHGQGKPLSMQADDVADNWTFLFWQLGMKY